MIIKWIEKSRLINSIKKNQNYIKYITFIRGDIITVWFINREREKGAIRYQFTRGLCLGVNYKGYNSNFLLRSVIKGVVFEQNFLYYSLNNIFIFIKKNIVRLYSKNKLIFLRKKKNKQSKIV